MSRMMTSGLSNNAALRPLWYERQSRTVAEGSRSRKYSRSCLILFGSSSTTRTFIEQTLQGNGDRGRKPSFLADFENNFIVVTTKLVAEDPMDLHETAPSLTS